MNLRKKRRRGRPRKSLLEKAKVDAKKNSKAFAKKCAPLYAILGWKWVRVNRNPPIPNEEEIEIEMNRLINGLDFGNYRTGTGGLNAEWYVDYDGSVQIDFWFAAVSDFGCAEPKKGA